MSHFKMLLQFLNYNLCFDKFGIDDYITPNSIWLQSQFLNI